MAESGQATVGLNPGTKIGKYVVVERLAIGGQAIVYKCHDPLLDRHVAIKQISSHLAEDPRFLERFRREAQILARLGAEQPTIVTIHELIEDERGLFIVMEYVAGNTLETVLSQNPQPVESKAVLQIIWRLAAGLHAVHHAGIIHRDIKPGNIIVGEGLRVKIADFGVAASASGQTSMVLGTTKYMAPEVFAGQTPDARMDMYSLGFIAYEMLLGRAKFNEVFADVVRDKHSESQRWMKWHGNEVVQAPLLHEVNPSIPQALSAIVARMMAKDPDKRFAGMEELGRAIKTSFSPRARAAAAAAAPAGVPAALRPPPGPSRSGVFQAIAGTSPGGSGVGMRSPDEADELDVVQSPATAELPKKKMSRQTKIIALAVAAGVMILGVAAVLAWQYTQDRDRRDKMLQVYKSGDAYFKKGEWADAVKCFKSVLSDSGNPGAAQSSVLIHIANANLSVEAALAAADKDQKEKHWAAEAEFESAAGSALSKVQASRSDLYDWTRQMRDELDKFAHYRSSSRQFDEAITEASAELAAKRYAKAKEVLTAKLSDVASLTRAQEDRIRGMRRTITVASLKETLETRIHDAERLAGEKQYVQAMQALEDAEKELSGSDAEMLSGTEAKKYKDEITRIRSGLSGEQSLAAAMQAVDEAHAAGDKDKELIALRRVEQMKPSPEISARIREVQASKALDLARQAKAANNVAEARQYYRDSLALKPDKNVEKELADLDKALERQSLVQQGDAAAAANQLDDALAKYKKAQDISGDADVAAKITAIEFKRTLAEGDRLAAAGDDAKAVDMFEKARTLNPGAAADIDARLAEIARNQRYRAAIAEGDRLFEAKQWGKAREAYTRAQKVKDTPEAKKRISQTFYGENKELGLVAMDQRDYRSAEGYFKLAQRHEDTPEIRELIAKAQKAAQGQP